MIDFDFGFNPLVCLGLMIFAGMAFGRLAKLCKLPNVTGYLVAGLLFGPQVLNMIPESFVTDSAIVSDIALGIIAFTIGNEFRISYFRKVGISPLVIATFESLLAVVFVVLALIAIGTDVPFALSLGAIAAATAPAATVMVIKQYKAKGPVTETLLSVVAIDDATALIFFGLASSIAKTMISDDAGSIVSMLLKPILEIVGSLVVGFVMGIILAFCLRWFKKSGNRLSLALGFVFAGAGIASMTGLSALLLCMALGAAFANLSKDVVAVMDVVDSITPPIFMLFFVDSGAGLQLSVLPKVGIIGVCYILFRVVGKLLGASLGAKLCKCPPAIVKYLGPALIPQAGVAIGLSLVAGSILPPEMAEQIRAIILCSTLVYELVGPGISKFCLEKAGEITVPGKTGDTK